MIRVFIAITLAASVAWASGLSSVQAATGHEVAAKLLAAEGIAPESINLADSGVGAFSRRFNSFGQPAAPGEAYTYGEFRAAGNPGEMAGARAVRTVDTSTGDTLNWQLETYDSAGNVRSIRPQWGDERAPHYIYDVNGNFVEERP